jgi:hypothetical protein
MEQSFDKYLGAPQNYTKALIEADFPRSAPRPTSASPDPKPPGLQFSKGFGRGYVGDGVLRSEHPQGPATHLLLFRLLNTAAFTVFALFVSNKCGTCVKHTPRFGGSVDIERQNR